MCSCISCNKTFANCYCQLRCSCSCVWTIKSLSFSLSSSQVDNTPYAQTTVKNEPVWCPLSKAWLELTWNSLGRRICQPAFALRAKDRGLNLSLCLLVWSWAWVWWCSWFRSQLQGCLLVRRNSSSSCASLWVLLLVGRQQASPHPSPPHHITPCLPQLVSATTLRLCSNL
jgi:hypothetical protein